ncbi:hypothetical protein HK102_004020 [Quaeritorhiza haematococci]|nr:hypothetical protein HK102_004020 [Quaeritorhiza haematococci]
MCFADIKKQPTPGDEPRSSKTFTHAEIKARVAATKEVIFIFNNKVYNVTKWLKYHPGGPLTLKHMAGKDATDQILAFHPVSVIEKKFPAFCIGEVDPTSVSISPENAQISKSWRKLKQKLEQDGLFKTEPMFYIREFAKFALLWSAMVYLVVAGPKHWAAYMLSSLLAAVLWHQAAFVGHDAGHNAVAHSRLVDYGIGVFLGNFIGGISIGWWKKSHNVHHIVTNSPEHDPDIQHLPFFAVTTRFFDNIYSTYHNRVLHFDKFARVFVAMQHYLFYVVLMFGRFNLYAQSIMFLINDRPPTSLSASIAKSGSANLLNGLISFKKRNIEALIHDMEIAGYIGFWVWFCWLLSHLPSWPAVFAYVFVSHAFTFWLHVQITISHFGMPTEDAEEDEAFAKKALRTTMDVECPTWMDWFHGGLQYQCIHHLFPRIPRHNLRKIRPLIQAFAAENNLTYHSHGFVKSNKVVLGAMKEVADQVAFLAKVGEGIVSDALKHVNGKGGEELEIMKKEQ